MPNRKLDESDLPKELQTTLDDFREADDELSAVINAAKEENPDFFSELENLQTRRNSLMEKAKTALKSFYQPLAEEDRDLGESQFGEFILQPRRTRGWDVQKFLEAADDLGVFEELATSTPPGIISTPEYHFNADLARTLGVLDDLVKKDVVRIVPHFDVDGKVAEDRCDGATFAKLQEAAWEEKIKSLACKTPPPSVPL